MLMARQTIGSPWNHFSPTSQLQLEMAQLSYKGFLRWGLKCYVE